VSKVLCQGNNLQDKLLKGITKLSDYVSSTLGPEGKNVILKSAGKSPFITKDGVTVANHFSVEDSVENAGIDIIKQVANKTNNEAGDGTTTSTVLAAFLLKEAQKYLKSGVSIGDLQTGMECALKQTIAHIENNSRHIQSLEEIEHVASISANNDKTIGKIVSLAVDQAGKNGAITIDEARSAETSLDVIEGFVVDAGYVSPQFITDERQRICTYEDCLIFVTDHKLEFIEPLMPILELAAREGRPLIIIADEVIDQMLAALIMNAVRGSMKVGAVKAPRYGEERRSILDDLALSTGATFFTRESGKKFNEFKLTDFGRCKSVEIKKNSATFVGGKGDYDKVDERIDILKDTIAETEEALECERLQERITRLASGVAIIKVGGATDVEVIEKRHRIEDALEAVRAAQADGIHPGGGIALVRAYQRLVNKDLKGAEKLGFDILRAALLSPLKVMALNAGLSPDLILNKVLEDEKVEMGINIKTGELVDMYEAGIIDPVKVTKSALTNAKSAVSVLISSGHAIIEE
jgi:chaperonin GroEL|tara:strand:- start:2597 stop:4168 length:1572 start_codon:yes stop_codon:yes gene_type:complete